MFVYLYNINKNLETKKNSSCMQKKVCLDRKININIF